MYLQNEKMAKLRVFVDFSNKRRFEQIYKTSLQNKTVRYQEVVGKCFVKKVFLKSTETHNFAIISYCECILKNFTKFTGKHLCWSLFFDKVAGLRPETLFKKKLQHRCLPVYFVKFLRTLSLKNTSGGCFCTKDLFLPIFCKEKGFKQIFFQLSGLASSNISFYMTKLGVFIKNLFI